MLTFVAAPAFLAGAAREQLQSPRHQARPRRRPPSRAPYACSPSPSSSSSSSSYSSASPSPLSSVGAAPVVFVLGGPGSGKGTQCALLRREFGVHQLCVGDVLRGEAATQSALGLSVAETMRRGEIVPGHITMSLLRRELDKLSSSTHSSSSSSSSSSFPRAVLIDGFPRAMDQAVQFETEAAPCAFVLFFKCAPSVMVARLRARAQTSGRDDDAEAVFQARLATFDHTTMPVIEHYRKRGLLREVDAQTGGPDEVYKQTRLLFTQLFDNIPVEPPSV